MTQSVYSFSSDVSHAAHDAEIERIKKLPHFPLLVDDPEPNCQGVLLADKVQEYATSLGLIVPFNPELLKPAGYELTMGDEYSLDGEYKRLGSGQSLEIPPFQVAVLKTEETINLPAFLVARWNIRVKWAYKGLLWVGGPQVDPQYCGHLFCPIYNLSNQAVEITRHEPIALIDFARTTPVPKDAAGNLTPRKYERPPKRVVLSDYEILQSAHTSQVGRRLDKLEVDLGTYRDDNSKKIETQKSVMDDRFEKLGNRVDSFIGVVFTVLGLLIAALAFFQGRRTELLEHIYVIISGAISVIALLVSLLFLAQRREAASSGLRNGVFAVGVVAIIVYGWMAFRISSKVGDSDDAISELSKQQNTMRAGVDSLSARVRMLERTTVASSPGK